MSVLRILGKYIHDMSYDDLSPAAIECAQIRLLDYLGTAFHASGAGPWKPLIKVFQENSGKEECTVIGEELKLPCAQAAMVNTYPHMSEGARVAGGHCAWIAMPAALAAAERRAATAPVSGKDLILAIVLAYEVMLRIGEAIYPAVHEKGFQVTTVRGPVGAAVAAAKLFGFDEDTTVSAMSIAASMGAGLEAATTPWQFYCFQIGRASESGMLAALAAEAGIKGNETILEEGYLKAFGNGAKPENITANLNGHSSIENTYLKVHFGCRHAHPAIDACLDVMKEHKLSWQDIENIKITSYPTALVFCHSEGARSVSEIFYDMKALVALGIVHGSEAMRFFRDDVISSEPLQEISKRITLGSDPELEKDFPRTSPAIAEITVKDGRTFTHRRDLARGEPEDPLDQAEIVKKFHYLTYRALDDETRGALLRFIDGLPGQDSLADLFALMSSNHK
jgi:2-methylcitrate dehydratase PrpD